MRPRTSEFPTKSNEYRRERRGKYPAKFRANRMMQDYGISEEQYASMLAKQGNTCAICKKPETGIAWKTGAVKRLAVDHDRKCCPKFGSCGKCVRGLLCSRCNPAIGLLRENKEILTNAIDYLTDPASINAFDWI
jgi:recombination endonuclease VII